VSKLKDYFNIDVRSKGDCFGHNFSLVSTKTLTFYIPKYYDTIHVISKLIHKSEELTSQSKKLYLVQGFITDKDLGKLSPFFSKRMYFYCETELTEQQHNLLDRLCLEKNIFVTIRSKKYLKAKMNLEQVMAFISHDSRDKDSIARPIAQGLQSRLCKVWYDEYSLQIGDSLRESIEKGIKESQKCIIILTKNFLNNPGWCKKEFNSIFTREIVTNTKVVLPIWYGVTKEEVYEYSPSLLDTFALIWPNKNELSESEFNQKREILISKIHTVLEK